MHDTIYWALLFIFVPLSVGVTTINVYRSWVEYRSRSKALDVLRVYAQRNEEPPASVTAALMAVGSGPAPAIGTAPGPRRPPARADHLAHVASNLVGVLAWGFVAWWRLPLDGESGVFVILAAIFALFCGALLAGRLVGVFTTAPGGLPAAGWTRAKHMANAAGNLVGMVGSAAIAWWRVPDEGNPGGLAITAVIAAIVCAGGLAANLVWARATPGSDQSRDDR